MILKEIRVRRFLSMAYLSRKSGVSLSTIRDAEARRHTPSLSTCQKLARSLRIKPERIAECRKSIDKALGLIMRGMGAIPGRRTRPLSASQQAKLSLREIAKELGVSHTLLVLWRQGKRKLSPELESQYRELVTRLGYNGIHSDIE